MVRVHHKFVVVDGETDQPTIFTGSANFSGNSLHSNDENLLEITACPRIARIYFAEFLRLYDHYRARAAFNQRAAGDAGKFTLTPDGAWSRKYFVAGSPEEKARIAMAKSPVQIAGAAPTTSPISVERPTPEGAPAAGAVERQARGRRAQQPGSR